MYVLVSTGRFASVRVPYLCSTITSTEDSIMPHTTHTCTCKSMSFLYNANDLSERKKAMELMYIL